MSGHRIQNCLWYDGTAEDAARFYCETFDDSRIRAVQRAPSDYPAGQQGDVLFVEFELMGLVCMGLNGGDQFHHSEAFSMQVITDNQEQTDRYWSAIVGNGGEESMCGWCKDKWGVSWQITPRVLMKIYDNPDAAAKQRAFEAMGNMRKIDVAAIEAALLGEGA